ncbi:replication initiation protein [Azospirillum halopraeferens]|uniref:replication initiation protein n=1 Tax=Azospirillum halopraeferens TaxID=34010 RepID=UPI00041E5C4C|nr:replication initiation protein [Azospirillum halopraeferens]
MKTEISRIELGKPDDLINSPNYVSMAAAYLVNAILLNEQLNPSEENTVRRIPVRDVRLLLGAENSHNTQFLERVLDELLLTKITWGKLVWPGERDPEPDGEGGDGEAEAEADVDPEGEMTVTATTFLSEYAYRVRSKDGMVPERGFIKYRLNPRIHQIMREKRLVTNINLVTQRAFAFQYSQKLYEVLQRTLQRNPDKPSPSEIIRVADLRILLGVGPDRYPVFADLNRYVLKPAVDEISQASDIQVATKTLRQNRAAYGIEFTVTRKREFQFSLALDAHTLPELFRQAMLEKRNDAERGHVVRRLSSYNINKAAAVEYIEKIGLARVEEVIRLCEADFKAGYKPQNKNAYVRSCLKGTSTPGEFAARAATSGAEVEEGKRGYFETLQQEFGFTEAEAAKAVSDHDARRLHANIEYVRSQRGRGTRKLGKPYMKAALRDDYANSDEMEAVAAIAGSAVPVAGAESAGDHKMAVAALRARFAALDEAERAALLAEFETAGPPGPETLDRFRRLGPDHAQTEWPFYGWFLGQKKGWLRAGR